MGCFELVVDVVPEGDLKADQIAEHTRKVFVTGGHVTKLNRIQFQRSIFLDI